MTTRRAVYVLAGLAAILLSILIGFHRSEGVSPEERSEPASSRRIPTPARVAGRGVFGETKEATGSERVPLGVSRKAPTQEGDRHVDGFFKETDRWVCAASVTDADVRAFVRSFHTIPAREKRACLQRALNLIPDENAALISGILFDRTQPAEITKIVFADLMSRSDAIKKGVIAEIAKDKTHPCYSDVEWIYEVTGEKPAE